jgi:hypothetical protein
VRCSAIAASSSGPSATSKLPPSDLIGGGV